MQVHTFFEKKSPSEQLNQSTYLGVHLEVNDPFHLCIPLSELGEENIRVVIYSIGRKKEVIWGTYNFKSSRFTWYNACKADLTTIGRFLKVWNSANFETVADVVKNRITGAMRELLSQEDGLTKEEYKVLKYLLAYWRNSDNETYVKLEEALNDVDIIKLLNTLKIPVPQIQYTDFVQSDLPVEIDITKLKKYKDIINKEVLDYETGLNLSNIDRDVLYNIINNKERLQQLVSDFHNNVQTSIYNTDSFVAALSQCLTQEQCAAAGYEPDSCSIYEFLNEYGANLQ
jgi:hypothetical protein